MYVEFACYDEILEDEVKKQTFSALEYGVQGISVPSIFLSQIVQYMPHGIVLSSPIDYPHGRSETKIRNHEALKAIHNGANALDLVAHLTYLVNGKITAFIDDLSSAKQICEQHNVTLRVMIDYRILDSSLIKQACAVISSLNLEYVYMSTGYGVDSYEDNILLCNSMEKEHKLHCIANGNVYLKEHFDLTKLAKLFGVRFHKIFALKRCLVGV